MCGGAPSIPSYTPPPAPKAVVQPAPALPPSTTELPTKINTGEISPEGEAPGAKNTKRRKIGPSNINLLNSTDSSGPGKTLLGE